jgi:hypothetical protein
MKNNLISTLPQLNSLMTNTYIFALIIAVVAVLVALLAANLIPFQGGQHDRSYIKRRIWFIVIWFVAIAGFFLFNNFVVMGIIDNVAFRSKFMTCIALSSLIIFLGYALLSFILMKVFPRSKFGSILG